MRLRSLVATVPTVAFAVVATAVAYREEPAMASINDEDLPFNVITAGRAIESFMDQVCGTCYELREECECG